MNAKSPTRRTPLTAGLLLAAAFLSSATGEEPARATFSWPENTRIQVTEVALKNGNLAEMTYEAKFRRGEDDHFTVKLANYQFVKINGLPVPPEAVDALKPVIETFNTMPSLVINKAGELVDVRGIDKTVDASGKLIGELAKDDEKRKEMVEALQSEQAKALMRNMLSEYWSCWVDGWIDFPAGPGTTIMEDFDQPLVVDTESVQGTRTFQHLGKVADQPDHVHLRIEMSIEDPALTRAVAQMIKNMDEQRGKAADPELDTVPTIIANTAVEAKINLNTLRPIWAKRSKTVRAKSDDPKYANLKRTETSEYSFVWK